MVQAEPGTEQALMRKGQINIHTVRRKRVGSCTLGWGQEQGHLRALEQRLSRALSSQGGHVSLQPCLGVAPRDRSESSSRGARDDVVVNREVIPGLVLSEMAQE